MLGTPTVHSLATLGVTAALNALSVWPARVLLSVTGVLGGPDVTLEQMNAKSILIGT